MNYLYELSRVNRQRNGPRNTFSMRSITRGNMGLERFSYHGPRFFMFDTNLSEPNSGKSYSYNPINNSFSPLSLPPTVCENSSVFFREDKIFFFVGQVMDAPKNEWMGTVYSYSISKNEYSKDVFQSLRGSDNYRVNSVILPNHINQWQVYQVGGFDLEGNPVKSVAYYDFCCMKYDVCRNMSFNGDLRILRGTSTMGVNFLFTHSSQGIYLKWDPRESIKDSQKKHFDFISNHFNDYSIAPSGYSIFFTGGTNKYGQPSDDFYEFDIRMLNGFNKSKMPNGRRNHGSFVFDKKLYVLGGITGNVRDNRNIDVFKFPDGDWRLNSTKLPCQIDCKQSIFRDNFFL